MTKDFHNLSSLYEGVLISEQQGNSLPAEVKEKLDTFLKSAEGEKFLSAINKASKEIEQAANKNPKDASQVSESVVNEALPARWISQATGWKRGIQGQRVGDSGEKLDVQSHQVNKRFEILQKKIGSHLKELQRDLKTTSNADDSVKQEVDKMISSLETDHSIKPTESKFQDARHGIGRGVEWGTKAAVLGGIGAAIGAVATSLVGVVGIPALAIQGAVAAATRKVAADLLKGQKPNSKQVLIQSLIGAGAGAAFGLAAPLLTQYKNEIVDYVSGRTDTDQFGDQAFLNSPEGQYSPQDTTELSSSIKADWAKLSNNVFGQEGMNGAASNLSKNDNDVLGKITQALKDKNLDWTKLSLKQKAAIFDPIAKQVLNKK